MLEEKDSIITKKQHTTLNLEIGVVYNFYSVYRYHFDAEPYYHDPAWNNYLIRGRYNENKEVLAVFIGEDTDNYIFHSLQNDVDNNWRNHYYMQGSPYEMNASEGDIIIPKTEVLGAKFIRKGVNSLYDSYEYSKCLEYDSDDTLSKYYVFGKSFQLLVEAINTEISEYINIDYIKAYNNIQLIVLPKENSNVCKTSTFMFKTVDAKVGLRSIEAEGIPTLNIENLKTAKTISCPDTLTIVLGGENV